jgi:hypothetical protein
LAASLAVVLIATVREGGYALLAENLLQLPTRPGEQLVWGGHWRYHLLSELSLILMSFGAGGAMLRAAGYRGGHEIGVRVILIALAVFGVLTLMFVPKWESVRDPVFLGHQAREVFTLALVTIPLGMGVGTLLVREQWNGRNVGGTASLATALLWGAVGVVTAAFVAVGSIVTSAASQGQSESVAVLIFPHFFEHTLSYVISLLAAAVVIEWSAPVCPSGRPQA